MSTSTGPQSGLTPADIAYLHELHAAATPGDWKADVSPPFPWVYGADGECVLRHPMQAAYNATLVAAAHNALPALLGDAAEVASLRERVATLEAAIQRKNELLAAIGREEELHGWVMLQNEGGCANVLARIEATREVGKR